MFGAIIGDVVGSAYEHAGIKGLSLPLMPGSARITDDTIIISAVTEAFLHGRDYGESLRLWGRRHPGAGYGPGFEAWLLAEAPEPYGSAGNGAAVRAIPIGWLASSEEEVHEHAIASAKCTHNHEASYRAAKAIAMTIFRLRRGDDPDNVFDEISLAYDYPWKFDLDLNELHEDHGFDSHCDISVPIAFAIARKARGFEDAMSKGLYVGGDTDSILAMAGGIREAINPSDLPEHLLRFAMSKIRQADPGIIQLLNEARKKSQGL